MGSHGLHYWIIIYSNELVTEVALEPTIQKDSEFIQLWTQLIIHVPDSKLTS